MKLNTLKRRVNQSRVCIKTLHSDVTSELYWRGSRFESRSKSGYPGWRCARFRSALPNKDWYNAAQ